MIYPNKILIIKLGSIGDVVNTLPLMNVLKAGLPETELGWLIEPKSYPIVEAHQSVDRFIVYRRGTGLPAVRGALKEIRSFGPDLVFDLQRILRSSFFTAFSGCQERLGFDRRRCKEFSWIVTNRKITARDSNRHMVLQYLEFAEYLGLSWTDLHFHLPVSLLDREEAGGLLPTGFLKNGFIALNIGAAKPANRWPLTRWEELAGRILRKTPFSIVLTGSAEDTTPGRMIAHQIGDDRRLLDCTGRTTLKQLGGLFLLAETVVSGDTGPMHIASALGARIIGLFGPADPARTGPFRHLDLVVRSGVDCAPCGRRRCSDPICMEAITPESVFSKIFPGPLKDPD